MCHVMIFGRVVGGEWENGERNKGLFMVVEVHDKKIMNARLRVFLMYRNLFQ